MSTIAENLEALQQAKEDIAQAIVAKGGYVSQDEGFSSFAQSITQTIPDPGPQDLPVIFYDYDGTILYSYSAANFLNLSDMPANPTHEGLVAEGWNWTLADAKDYVSKHGAIDIGQLYHTESGLYEEDITADSESGMTVSVRAIYGTVIDWGDGTSSTFEGMVMSHTYSESGNYTIKSDKSILMFEGTYSSTDALSLKVKRIKYPAGNGIGGVKNAPRLESIVTGRVSQEDQYSIGGIGEGCPKLKHLNLPPLIVAISSGGFESSYIETISLAKGLERLESDAFYDCKFLKRVCIPEVLEELQHSTFVACPSLKEVIIPENIPETALYSTFAECISLRSIKIPSNITELVGTFSTCPSLVSVTFDDDSKLHTIARYAFYGCSSLESITIPAGVNQITSHDAISGCTSLTSITFLSENPPTIPSDGFTPSCRSLNKILVPHGALQAYVEAPNWDYYGSILFELPE